MPLLGRDHLSRGRGPIQLFNKILFTAVDLVVTSSAVILLCTPHGPQFAMKVIGDDNGEDEKYLLLVTEPLVQVRPFQVYILLAGICLYFFKVIFWTWTYSHSNTVGVGSALFVMSYHEAVVLSICMAAYLTNRMPTMWELVTASVIFFVALLQETLADRELGLFKKNSQNKGKLLDYGYHSMCRHPSYFFNMFSFPCLGLVSGSYVLCGMWLFIQIFWVYAQSGPGLGNHMATTYGTAWERYCQSVPFFFPDIRDLGKALSFQYVGMTTMASSSKNTKSD